MNWRRYMIIAIMLALLVSVGIATLMNKPRTAITRDNAAKIEPGMTVEVVQAILGGPPRSEVTGPLDWDDQPEGSRHEVGFLRHGRAATPALEWQSDQVVISVQLDGEGRVSSSYYIFLRPAARGILGKLCRAIGF